MLGVSGSNPTPGKTFFFNIYFRIYFENLQKSKSTFSDKNKNKNFMQKKFRGFPCKICGDFPVNSQLITCKSYILFNAISTCVPKVRNYGDFRQHVIPTVITCLLRGTPCDTGFSYTFYRGNICSVGKKYTNRMLYWRTNGIPMYVSHLNNK